MIFYFKKKKLSGILIESSNDHFIIGIGINVEQSESFFKDNTINGTSISLITNKKINISELYQELLATFLKTKNYYETNKVKLLNDYLSNCLNYKKYIRCRIGKSIKFGYFEDIKQDGSIVLKTSSGTELIHSGEIIE